MASNRICFSLCLLMISSFWGCSTVQQSASTLSKPLFIPTSEDAPRLSMLTHKLDTKALQCVEAANCEQVLFARALVSLFENRETARTAFRHVIDHNPSSPLAGSSQLWLRLMGDDEADVASMDIDSSPLNQIVAQFVREWMERQLAERQNFEKLPAPPASQAALVEQSRIVQGVQKQLRERDRQIAILRAQLEALKSIDQDHSNKPRKVKPPSSLRTVELYSE